MNYFGDFQHIFKVLIVINVMVVCIRMIFYVNINLESAYRVFNTLNKNIIYSNMAFFEKNPVGRVLNRLSNDLRVIDNELTWTYDEVIGTLINCIAYPLVIIYLLPWIAIVVFALIFTLL